MPLGRRPRFAVVTLTGSWNSQKGAEDHLRSTQQGHWLSRLNADRDNFRAVLAWSSQHDLARGIELAAALADPWEMHGQVQELVAWLERALATPGAMDPGTRAVGLGRYGAALLVIEQSDRAGEPLEESMVLFRELGDRLGEASALRTLDLAAWAKATSTKRSRSRKPRWRSTAKRAIGVVPLRRWLMLALIASR